MYLDPTACECRASGLLHLAATTGRNAARSREPTAYGRLVVASTRCPGLDGAARQPAGRWHKAAQASCTLAPAVERDAAHAFIHKSCARVCAPTPRIRTEDTEAFGSLVLVVLGNFNH